MRMSFSVFVLEAKEFGPLAHSPLEQDLAGAGVVLVLCGKQRAHTSGTFAGEARARGCGRRSRFVLEAG